jgi:uncharacterized RDD family membrane protein YckC
VSPAFVTLYGRFCRRLEPIRDQCCRAAFEQEDSTAAALATFTNGLGFFWIAFDDQKQAWHDKIAGTVVPRVAKGTRLV